MEAVVEAQRPTWVVVENVARGWRKWLPSVVESLRRLGYETLPVPMEARMVGAPHIRQRLFLLAHSDGFAIREHEQRLPGGWETGLRDGRQAIALEYGQHGGWETQPSFSVMDDDGWTHLVRDRQRRSPAVRGDHRLDDARAFSVAIRFAIVRTEDRPPGVGRSSLPGPFSVRMLSSRMTRPAIA